MQTLHSYRKKNNILISNNHRGLRSLCEAVLTDAMHELPSSDTKILEIDMDYPKETLNKNLLKRLEIAS